MTLGNLAALGQTNLKRMLAYSSIAHAGYALLGFVVFAERGVAALLFYLAVYYTMNLGAFWVVMLVANATGREDLDGCRGLAWRGGALPALALGVFLFSLAGLPPLAGFLGKFYVFAAGVEQKFYALVVIGLVNSVVSLYYYARVVKVMFLDRPKPEDRPDLPPARRPGCSRPPVRGERLPHPALRLAPRRGQGRRADLRRLGPASRWPACSTWSPRRSATSRT
jgi:NADH-quinone oxidoreductase subunit N